MITHDRYFLENITDEILEMENQSLYRYKGNFSYYLQKKAEREQLESVVQDKAQQLFKKELEWARKMPRARTVKSKARMESFHELKQSLIRNNDPENLELEINIQRMGSKIVEFHRVKKVFGNTTVLNGFDYVFKNRERIGIVGRNGTGKTTFLNMIVQQLMPDMGKVVVGETVSFGYFNQTGMVLKEGQRLLECVREVADFIPLTKGKTITASQMLERFMFPRNSHSNYVEKLSGGERKRLQLLLILMKNPNFLILDEPTNDLDIVTLNILEEFLEGYQGCMLMVTHDRYFMDRLVDHVFVLDGTGVVKDIHGNYTDYRELFEAGSKQASKSEKKEEKAEIKTEVAPVTKTKLSYKEQIELEKLPDQIDTLEKEQTAINNELANPDTYKDAEKVKSLQTKLNEIEVLLLDAISRWEELESKKSAS